MLRVFPISADDIGCTLVAQVIPIAATNLGVAHCEIGPFEIDPVLRSTIQNYIREINMFMYNNFLSDSGGSTFPVEM